MAAWRVAVLYILILFISMMNVTLGFPLYSKHKKLSPYYRCCDGDLTFLRCSSRIPSQVISNGAALNLAKDCVDPTNSGVIAASELGGASGHGDTVFSSRFAPTEELSTFVWKPPNVALNPAKRSLSCARLLLEDTFIDKSRALYNLLKSCFDPFENDFESVPLLLAYPRRFAKTTLLGFIEAVYSPLPLLNGYKADRVKTKIASLEKGKELLEFGLHPVVTLDLQNIKSVNQLNRHIKIRLEQAGATNLFFHIDLSPRECLLEGVRVLNQKFKAETGVATKTMVLIDEYDMPFRERERSNNDPLLKELVGVFSIGKLQKTGVSLLVLCGLTRIVGTGISRLNNLVDVSRETTFHGLCGITLRELVMCASGQLDEATRKQYGADTDFQGVLQTTFREQLDGFRFGLDEMVGDPDPNSTDGAMFSPMDVWEIVVSLLQHRKMPSSQWTKSTNSEIKFTSFSEKYTSSREGHFSLYRNLEGGWVDTTDVDFRLVRDEYLTLDCDTHVKSVLFELGLLSVHEIKGDWAHLVSPNETVLKNAMSLLLKVTNQGITTKALAYEHLSKSGFERIVSNAAMKVSKSCGGIGETAVNEYFFQMALFKELYYRFLVKDVSKIKLYKEKKVPLVTEDKQTKEDNNVGGCVDVAVTLQYEDCPTLAFLVTVKLGKIAVKDEESISEEHKKILKIARDQVEGYDWIEQVDMIQRVVVSGVWHPSDADDQSHVLSSVFEFLPCTKPSFKILQTYSGKTNSSDLKVEQV